MWFNNWIWAPQNEEIPTGIIRQHHDIPQAGHGGIAKTTELTCRTYFWRELGKDIKGYVKNCDTCKRIKSTWHAPYGQLQSLEVPAKPQKSIAMDFITDLAESEGNNTILVVIDQMIKMSHFIPCRKEMNAQLFRILFVNNIYKINGLPSDITNDQDRLFPSELWKETSKA